MNTEKMSWAGGLTAGNEGQMEKADKRPDGSQKHLQQTREMKRLMCSWVQHIL
jgi:hypothetical protein